MVVSVVFGLVVVLERIGQNQFLMNLSAVMSMILLRGNNSIIFFEASVEDSSPSEIFTIVSHINRSMSMIDCGLSFPSCFDYLVKALYSGLSSYGV